MDIKIAICDDNKDDLNRIQKNTEEIFAPIHEEGKFVFSICTYKNGNDLMRNFEEILNMHVLLLDIDMPGIDGMHIAKQIECRKHMVNIIFITNRNELVFDALHYRPFRFIRKERLLQELEEALLSVLEEIKQQTMYCEMEVGVNMVQICVSDVLYLESSGHYVIIHREDGRQEVLRAKISEFAKKLEKYGFLRVHVGYLVNVRNIYAINSKEIRLDNQEYVPVSRKYLEQVRRQHANYVRRMLFGIS